MQKLQNYGVRVATVREADVRMSSRFGEMLAEARRLKSWRSSILVTRR